MSTEFPSSPSITLLDPLARLLGAGDGVFHYTFSDVVKLSGHACPTVAGAYLMTIHALRALYGDEMPVRGEIHIVLPGGVEQGVNGPLSQVFTLITGAAAENGFHGLGGRFSRSGLMEFGGDMEGRFLFERVDSGVSVQLLYDASAIAPDPAMAGLMQQAMQEGAAPELKQQFALVWRDRVVRILQDGGEQTVSMTR